jgi:hypothetical protein
MLSYKKKAQGQLYFTLLYFTLLYFNLSKNSSNHSSYLICLRTRKSAPKYIYEFHLILERDSYYFLTDHRIRGNDFIYHNL